MARFLSPIVFFLSSAVDYIHDAPFESTSHRSAAPAPADHEVACFLEL
jgi:hypothetical protein